MLDLVEHDGVLVHPGYFFDFPREAFVIVSLLVAPDDFDIGVSRLLARVSATQPASPEPETGLLPFALPVAGTSVLNLLLTPLDSRLARSDIGSRTGSAMGSM